MNEEMLAPLRRALNKALTEARQSSAVQAQNLIQQWLHTLRRALPHAELWEESRALLLIVLDDLTQLGRLADAVEWFENGITVSEARGDSRTAATLKLELGREKVRQMDLEAAAALFHEGIAYFESEGIEYAPAYNAHAYFALGEARYEDAIMWAERALAALPEASADEWVERGQSYRNIGTALHRLSRYTEALVYFEKSLREWQSGGSPRYTAFGQVNFASSLRPLKRYDEAEARYLEAIEVFEAINDPVNRAIAQLNLGNVYLNTERWDSAINQYYHAEEALARNRQRLALAYLYGNWGMACQKLGEWEQALSIHKRNIDVWTELDNPVERGNEWDNVGISLMNLGRYEEAIEAFHAGIVDAKDSPPARPLPQELREHLEEAELKLKEAER